MLSRLFSSQGLSRSAASSRWRRVCPFFRFRITLVWKPEMAASLLEPSPPKASTSI